MSSNLNKYQRRKRKNQIHQMLTIFAGLLLAILLTVFLLRIAKDMLDPEEPPEETEMVTEQAQIIPQQEDASPETEKETEALPQKKPDEVQEAGDANAAKGVYDPDNPVEAKIYSFLQGPKAWSYKIDWSGAWCHEEIGGQEFGAFGCGLCVLANIYSSLTEWQCSPLDMYEHAVEVSTTYTAEDGVGAIDWPEMKQVLKTVGISCSVKRKNKSYEKFQENIAAAQTAVVLVCSDNDDTYWQNVSGHYVNIWAYNSEDDTVFLADPGNYKHNRKRIPLRYVYDALKTAGTYQYLLVTGVDPDGDSWQHEQVSGKWKRPKYIPASGG